MGLFVSISTWFQCCPLEKLMLMRVWLSFLFPWFCSFVDHAVQKAKYEAAFPHHRCVLAKGFSTTKYHQKNTKFYQSKFSITSKYQMKIEWDLNTIWFCIAEIMQFCCIFSILSSLVILVVKNPLRISEVKNEPTNCNSSQIHAMQNAARWLVCPFSIQFIYFNKCSMNIIFISSDVLPRSLFLSFHHRICVFLSTWI